MREKNSGFSLLFGVFFPVAVRSVHPRVVHKILIYPALGGLLLQSLFYLSSDACRQTLGEVEKANLDAPRGGDASTQVAGRNDRDEVLLEHNKETAEKREPLHQVLDRDIKKYKKLWWRGEAVLDEEGNTRRHHPHPHALPVRGGE